MKLREDYYPTKLPCGVKVNQHYTPNTNMNMESCSTVCTTKNNSQIDMCYKIYKGEKKNGFFI